jgi:hypothetical protein
VREMLVTALVWPGVMFATWRAIASEAFSRNPSSILAPSSAVLGAALRLNSAGSTGSVVRSGIPPVQDRPRLGGAATYPPSPLQSRPAYTFPLFTLPLRGWRKYQCPPRFVFTVGAPWPCLMRSKASGVSASMTTTPEGRPVAKATS